MFTTLRVSFWLACLSLGSEAFGAGGFFVAGTSGDQHSDAAKVVFVRDDKRTVMTLVPSYNGSAKDIAFVVPIPVILERKQIHVGDPKVIARLEAFSAPRLTEYFDTDPCEVKKALRATEVERVSSSEQKKPQTSSAHPVVVERSYKAGPYDIAILSTKENTDLAGWLGRQGYKVSAPLRKSLVESVASGMKFLVAKFKMPENGGDKVWLDPLQIAYESEKFELPIRLGLSGKGEEQEVHIFALTRQGRVDVVNYEVEKVPSGMELPAFVRDGFADFYATMLDNLYLQDKGGRVYLEYAFAGNWCDPCSAEPLTDAELRSLGAYWVKSSAQQNVFITRLYARYSAKAFPHDLQFKVTDDRNNFQSRYVIRQPFTGEAECPRLESYRLEVVKKQKEQAATLARLTGWPIDQIRKKMAFPETSKAEGDWIDSLWTE